MASVELAQAAADKLAELIATHYLPADARSRVRSSLTVLERFPLAGRGVPGDRAGLRFVLGPWRWLVIIYDYDASIDRVVILGFRDASSSTQPGHET